MTDTLIRPLLGWYEDLDTPLARGTFVVLNLHFETFCAYVGVPITHPLANRSYNDMPLECHGGLTYGAPGQEGTHWLPGWYWYGWDYAHSGDYAPYLAKYGKDGGYVWTLEEVQAEAQNVLNQLKALMEKG